MKKVELIMAGIGVAFFFIIVVSEIYSLGSNKLFMACSLIYAEFWWLASLRKVLQEHREAKNLAQQNLDTPSR